MHHRSGSTLLNCLVLLACVLIVLGLLLPAIHGPRGPHRRSQCSTQIKNLALASIQYENTHGQFPGWCQSYGLFPGGADPTAQADPQVFIPAHHKVGSWVVSLMPYLDAQPTYELWTEDQYPILVPKGDSANETENAELGFHPYAAPSLRIMQCPSQPSRGESDEGRNSYVCNAGMSHLGPNGGTDWTISREGGSGKVIDFAASMAVANGVFNNQLAAVDRFGREVAVGPAVDLEDLRDGASHTILFSENLQARPWHQLGFATPSEWIVQNQQPPLYPTMARFTQGMVWHYEDDDRSGGAAPVQPTHRINGFDDAETSKPPFDRMTRTNASDLARPSSAHVEGVNVAAADGATRFIDESIDYQVYQALLTPDGQASDVPDPDFVLSEEDLDR